MPFEIDGKGNRESQRIGQTQGDTRAAASAALPPDVRLGALSLARPAAVGANVFADLPFPNPGDRIRAEDFRTLSRSLLMVRDALSLSGALFGQPLAQAIPILAAQQIHISRVMTVFGTEIENLEDPSLNNRKVIQVLPINLGEPEVVVVVTEAVETRRFAPNLLGLSYREASERLRNIMGDVTFPSRPMNVSQLVGMTLAEARGELTRGG